MIERFILILIMTFLVGVITGATIFWLMMRNIIKNLDWSDE